MEKVAIRPVEVKATIVCQSCHREVETNLIAYGQGYIGACPLCGKLAYHEDELPGEIGSKLQDKQETE